LDHTIIILTLFTQCSQSWNLCNPKDCFTSYQPSIPLGYRR